MSNKVHLPLDAKILLADIWREQHPPPKTVTKDSDDDGGKDDNLPSPGRKPKQHEPER